jgi:eukaryotic-like serine/threonine-protein kinase
MAEFEIAPVRVVGRYALYEEIATGGMATVHVGRLRGAVGFAKTVAIKRLHPQYARNSEFVSMFVDEARLAARIRHPNVVQTLDVVQADGELFLVMEYIQGESLARLNRLLRAMGERIPHPIVVSIMAGALQGLHAAHETRDEHGRSLDLVHRDVSPQNVMVGVDGLSRVLDFGIARAAGRVHTSQNRKVKGKLGYIAPEQIQSGVVTRQADVYSASVVLWEVLTGQRLFQGDNQATVVAQVMAGQIRPPSQVKPGTPPTFDAVVMKGLSRDPSQRFATAREMALALENACSSASLASVAGWLEGVAGESLTTRADKVARFERSSDVNEVSHLRAMVDELASGVNASPDSRGAGTPPPIGRDAALSPQSTRKRSGFRGVVIAVALLALVGAPAAWFVLKHERGMAAAAAAPPEPTTAAATAEPVATAAATETSSAAAAASAAPEVSAAAAPSAAPTAPVVIQRRAPAPAKRSSSKSSSPFKNLGGRQ